MNDLNFTPSHAHSDWAEYFRERAAHIVLQMSEAVLAADEAGLEILEAGHQIQAEELPKKIFDHVKVMHQPAVRKSVTFERGKPFKTGPRAGELRPDKEVEHYGVASISNDYILTAVWSGGTLQYAKFWNRNLQDDIRWTESINELKGWIKNG